MPVKWINSLDEVSGLTKEEKEKLKEVTKHFRFFANDYYLSLIDWNDPKDPIRRLIIPSLEELEAWGDFDPSGEAHYMPVPGVEHKYGTVALFLSSAACGGLCRYCFRKRIFYEGKGEKLVDLDKAIEYVKEHKEITNVLLSGGDPLMLSNDRIDEILTRLREIEHVKIIRFGTRIPVYNPYRILEDDELINILKKHNRPDSRIYFITHFMHVKELTDVAIKAIDKLLTTGIIMANQTPMIRGVTDNHEWLAALFEKLSHIGVPPYYVFQCRPTIGNKTYAVPIEEGYQIFERAKSLVSGLAKRARFAMSHKLGKVEIVGLTDEHVFFKFLRAHNRQNSSKFFIAKRNPNAYWLDDYEEIVKEFRLWDKDERGD